MTVSGSLNLILCDGAVLTFDEGISLPEGSTLTVYGGVNGTGELRAQITKYENCAAIGGSKKQHGGNLIVHGGKVFADNTKTSKAPAIGGGGGEHFHMKGSITVYGGELSAKAGKYGAGIGGGFYGNMEGSVTVYGGSIKAFGGRYGAGIGGGEGGSMNGSVNIWGGSILTNGGEYAGGIGGGQQHLSVGGNLAGDFNLYSGLAEAYGGYCGAGIGGGEDGGFNGNVNISGGVLNATGSEYGAGFGSGDCGNCSGSVTISGGDVTASSYRYGAGIGGGRNGKSGPINISGGTVNAAAGLPGGGAGIGGGSEHKNNVILISGGKIKATATFAAGIGAGDYAENGPITITGGEIIAESDCGTGIGAGGAKGTGQGADIIIEGTITDETHYSIPIVTAVCKDDSAGIGGGGGNRGGDAKNIIIRNALVAAGSKYGAGIGGGGNTPYDLSYSGGKGGNVVIDNSAVYAVSANRGAGIGGGNGKGGDGGTLLINNSYVEAIGGYENFDYYKERTEMQTKYSGLNIDSVLSIIEGKCYEKMADYILDALLSGEYAGSGIGGGENGKGGSVTVTGKSTVIATGGMSTTAAIGHGRKQTDNGSLSIPDNARVKAGADYMTAQYVSAQHRISACQNNPFAVIQPACDHYYMWRCEDKYNHKQYCVYCNEVHSDPKAHIYDDDHVCTVCGYKSDTATVITHTKGSEGWSTASEQTLLGSYYELPECQNVPDGYEFAGWKVDYQDSVVHSPGDIIQINSSIFNITAYYFELEDATYTDENGKTETVTARRIKTSANLLLTTGWYVLDSDNPAGFAADEYHNMRATGNVRLILKDGQTLKFKSNFADVSNISADSLTIYGQEQQTGKLETTGGINKLSHFAQYGGIVKIPSNLTCTSFNAARGNFNAGTVKATDAIIGGGNTEINYFYASNARLGYSAYSDTIKLNNITISDGGSVEVEEGKSLIDNDSGSIYTGKLSEEMISSANGKLLTAYHEHTFGEPEWIWSEDNLSATAKFVCRDEGCGAHEDVEANVRADEYVSYTNFYANCIFEGKYYSTIKTETNRWKIEVRDCENGTVTADREKAEYNEEVTLTITPDDGRKLGSLRIIDDDGDEVTVTDNKFRMPSCGVTVRAEFIYEDGIGARLAGHSLSLNGDIGVNFYMELSDDVAESDTAHMYFTIPGNTTAYQTVYVRDAETEFISGTTYYKFPCKVAAKEMTSQIKAQIRDGSKSGTEYLYSVKDYADYLIEHRDESETFKKAVPLAQAMLRYGSCAKDYFDKSYALADIGNVEIPEPETEFTLPEGVTFEGATLSLKLETTLSLYFKSGTPLAFACGGKTVETDSNGGYRIARIRGIAAGELQSSLTLTVASGQNSGMATYSPMNYCCNVLKTDPEAEELTDETRSLQNTVEALYLYSEAAKSYFKGA